MVPGAFVYLDHLPLTPNGKVDRAALPVPDAPAAAAAATGYVPPVNDAERALQGLWEEVLNARPVSVTARFEDLGGHSLLAAQLVSRIETRLGHKVPLEALFTAPTVRDLAGLIQRKLELGGGGSLVPLNTEGNQPPIFLIAGAGGHVFTFHKFARLLGPDFPAYGMKAIGVDGSEPPLDRVEPIAERYLGEILKARPKGPYVLAGYSVGGLMAFEVARLMQQRGIEVARVVLFDTFAPGYPRPLPWPVRHGHPPDQLPDEARRGEVEIPGRAVPEPAAPAVADGRARAPRPARPAGRRRPLRAGAQEGVGGPGAGPPSLLAGRPIQRPGGARPVR